MMPENQLNAFANLDRIIWYPCTHRFQQVLLLLEENLLVCRDSLEAQFVQLVDTNHSILRHSKRVYESQ